MNMTDMLYRRYADPIGAMAAAGKVYPFFLYLIRKDTEEKNKQEERLEWELFLHSNTGNISFKEWRERLHG